MKITMKFPPCLKTSENPHGKKNMNISRSERPKMCSGTVLMETILSVTASEGILPAKKGAFHGREGNFFLGSIAFNKKNP